MTQLAQTTMRSELGKIDLDQTFKERNTLNLAIVEAMNSAAADWGMKCLRYEIRKPSSDFEKLEPAVDIAILDHQVTSTSRMRL